MYKKSSDPKTEIGRQGEAAAMEYLRQKGFTLIQANYRSLHGEIDLIISDGEYIVFVEVKTRNDEKFVRAESSVGRAKLRRIARTATSYMLDNPTELQPRFDIVILVGNPPDFEVRHYKNVYAGE